MRGFLLGLLSGALVSAAVTWFVMSRRATPAKPGVALSADAGVPDGKPKKKHRGGSGDHAGVATGQAPVNDNEPDIVLSPADLKVTAEGDSLTLPPRTVDLSAASQERDLTRSEIDGAIAPAADAIIACITDATGSAPVAGRVVAGVAIDEQGHVTRTRVEGPAYLMKHGLGGCVRPKLRALHFPATGKPTVVRVPFNVS